jgi:hypothetical protein
MISRSSMTLEDKSSGGQPSEQRGLGRVDVQQYRAHRFVAPSVADRGRQLSGPLGASQAGPAT